MTTNIDIKAFETYFVAMNQSLQKAVSDASAAYHTLVDTRTLLGLPVEDPLGITPELQALSVKVAEAAALANVAVTEAVAGKRQVGYNAQLDDFSIEALPGDTKRLVLVPGTPGFEVVPIPGGESGAVDGLPALVWGGVAVTIVQATAVYFVVSESADMIKVVARKRTEQTIAKTAGQYAKLVDEGKATPDQAKALTDSLFAGSAELAKAAPPPPPPEDTPGGKVKTIANTATTIAWLGLAAVVLYGGFQLASAHAARKALTA